jgi:hypothetical protein
VKGFTRKLAIWNVEVSKADDLAFQAEWATLKGKIDNGTEGPSVHLIE